MHCMRCGKKTEGDQVFCAHCLEEMEKYPVKSDVHIQLPNRPSAAAQKKQNRKKHPQSKDEQIARLRRKNRWMGFWITLLLLALLALLGKAYLDVRKTDDADIGKNYTYTEPTQ